MNHVAHRLAQALRPHWGWFALLAAMGLVGVGIPAIDTVPRAPTHPDFAGLQTRWLLVAGLAWAACLYPHPKQVMRAAYALMVATALLLLVVVAPGVPEALVPVRNGVRHWINLRFMMLQPSELAKVAFVLALARYLQHRESYRTLPGLLVPFAIMFLPLAMVLRQPDLGTALLFPPVLFAMLLAAGARLKHLGTLLALGLLALALNLAVIFFLPDSMQLLKPYQVNRVRAMVDMARGGSFYADREGYQQQVGMMLTGAGGATGLGAQRSALLLKHHPLPEAHNDMVFVVVVNRWGWVGGGLLLALYALLVWALVMIALRNKDPFARLAVVGFAALTLAQVAINVGMALGVAPIIGITLPFVSYGGSSLVVGFLMVGLAFNFAARQPDLVLRPSFEFDHADALAR